MFFVEPQVEIWCHCHPAFDFFVTPSFVTETASRTCARKGIKCSPQFSKKSIKIDFSFNWQRHRHVNLKVLFPSVACLLLFSIALVACDLVLLTADHLLNACFSGDILFFASLAG